MPVIYVLFPADNYSPTRSSSILTEKPHLAGTPQDKEQADWVSSQWKQFGMDSVKIVPYNVLLSYPRMDKPNLVSGNHAFP